MTITIEYRHKDGLDQPFSLSRRDVPGLTKELKVLVGQVRSVGIDMLFKETRIEGDEPNTLLIGGRNVEDVLEGLDIVREGGCSTCSANCSEPTCETSKEERDELDWNRRVLEDIPEVLLKNAISKVIADSR
ncbi:MAG: hypothetical protein PHW93_02080 [Candidatus Methanomethylophilaceae archaeon]|nr:hypothetical protein [Candidatus Methanomethylophilaceae archaeon]